jgi:hypothetical protein
VRRSLACLRGEDARVESRDREKSEYEIGDHDDDRFGVVGKTAACLGRSLPSLYMYLFAFGALASTIVMVELVATVITVLTRRIPYAGIRTIQESVLWVVHCTTESTKPIAGALPDRRMAQRMPRFRNT